MILITELELELENTKPISLSKLGIIFDRDKLAGWLAGWLGS